MKGFIVVLFEINKKLFLMLHSYSEKYLTGNQIDDIQYCS